MLVKFPQKNGRWIYLEEGSAQLCDDGLAREVLEWWGISMGEVQLRWHKPRRRPWAGNDDRHWDEHKRTGGVGMSTRAWSVMAMPIEEHGQCGLKHWRGGEGRGRERAARWRKATRRWPHGGVASGVNRTLLSFGPTGQNGWTTKMHLTIKSNG
jgi:hypothetical protein